MLVVVVMKRWMRSVKTVSKYWIVYETITYKISHVKAENETEAINYVIDNELQGKLLDGSDWDVVPMEEE